MPTLLRVEGFRFFFSNEGQEPPHVHVSKGDGIAKVWLIAVALAYASGLAPAELRRVRELTREHESMFVERAGSSSSRTRWWCTSRTGAR
jgi:hypothetical protein